MSVTDPVLLYRERSCARQWRGFMAAMAEEFASELPASELQVLMARIGRRFAAQQPLEACHSVEDVQAAANRVWDAMEWGRCHMAEEATHVTIAHVGAPLALAMQQAAWSDGFLAGAYAGWFRQAGMPAGLDVQVIAPVSEDIRRFELTRLP